MEHKFYLNELPDWINKHKFGATIISHLFTEKYNGDLGHLMHPFAMIRSFDKGSMEVPFILICIFNDLLEVRCSKDISELKQDLVELWPKPGNVLIFYNKDVEKYYTPTPDFGIGPTIPIAKDKIASA